MRLLFLSGLYSNELINDIVLNSKTGVDYSSNTLQWHILNGLIRNCTTPIRVVTAPFVGSYPLYYKKIAIKRNSSYVDNNCEIVSVGFLNISVIKNLFIKKSLLKELEKSIISFKNDEVVIVVYSMHAPWMKAALLIKEKFSNVSLMLVVPDLPEYINSSAKLITRVREYFKPNLYKLATKYDYFVFLTEFMAKHFDTKKPWIRVEGMINVDDLNLDNNRLKKSENKKVVLYTGSLSKRYGIESLLLAFSFIKDENYELWICGEGDCKFEIINMSIKDNRIKYFGQVKREEVLRLQSIATININPRDNTGDYTKFSFPSKIMEYLLSGTPCLMFELIGIPKEYSPYYYKIDSSDPVSLSRRIVEICEKDSDELLEFGLRAREFVLTYKNHIIQTKKILELIS